MPNFAKVFTGIVGASAVGGLSYGAIMLNKGPTVKSKLLSEGFELASNGDWKGLFEEHEKNNPPKKNIFKDEDGKEKNEAWLQAKCKEVLRKNHEDNDSYKLATQWCVKKETIKTILSKEGKKFRFLDTTEGSEGKDKDYWTKKIADLKNNPEAINKLLTPKTKETITENDLKTKCKEMENVETISDDFNDKFELAKAWCSV